MTSSTLRDKLIGTWKLEEHTSEPSPSSQLPYKIWPHGYKVDGLLLYTPDGYMSSTIREVGQYGFKPDLESTWLNKHFTFTGRYHISIDDPASGQEVVRHKFEFGLPPKRVGELEIWTPEFEEDGAVMVLTGRETKFEGTQTRIPIFKWRRADDNAGRPPPPPIPDIRIG